MIVRDCNSDIKIDRNLLEEECEEHASRYIYWSNLYVEAVAKRDQIKRQLDQVKAQLSLEVRKTPSLLGGVVKITNDSVSEYVITHNEYITLDIAHLEAKKEALLLGGVKDAFEHRRGNLQDLVKLWLNAYYSEVGVSEGAKKVADDKVMDVHRQMLNRSKENANG